MIKKSDVEYIQKIDELNYQLIPEIIAIKFRQEENIMVVMSKNQNIEFLNAVARDFFCKIDKHKTLFQIIKELYEEYEIDYEEFSSDIMDLVRELQRKRIIRLNFS